MRMRGVLLGVMLGCITLLAGCVDMPLDELKQVKIYEQFTVDASVECLYEKLVEVQSGRFQNWYLTAPIHLSNFIDRKGDYAWFRINDTLITLTSLSGDETEVVERRAGVIRSDYADYFKSNPCAKK